MKSTPTTAKALALGLALGIAGPAIAGHATGAINVGKSANVATLWRSCDANGDPRPQCAFSATYFAYLAKKDTQALANRCGKADAMVHKDGPAAFLAAHKGTALEKNYLACNRQRVQAVQAKIHQDLRKAYFYSQGQVTINLKVCPAAIVRQGAGAGATYHLVMGGDCPATVHDATGASEVKQALNYTGTMPATGS